MYKKKSLMRDMVKKIIKSVIDISFSNFLLHRIRHFLYFGYKLRFYSDWRLTKKTPTYFKHEFDLYTWIKNPGDCEWVEPGIYARQNMFTGCTVLDLCCGDGTYPYLFYSSIAKKIVAVDRDEYIINYCKKYSSSPNIEYHKLDIMSDYLPNEKYDIVVMNSVLHYFSENEINLILEKIAKICGNDFVFCGNTIVQFVGSPYTKNKFRNKEDLNTLLSKHFNIVSISSSWYPTRRIHPERINLNYAAYSYKNLQSQIWKP